MQHRLGHEGAFAGVLLQKFHTGGGVVKQVVDRDGRAHRASTRLHTLGLAALDAVAAGILVGFGLGQHLDLGNAGNRRQRLAAEAQGVDVPEVVRRSNLAGSMADKRLIDIFCLDA